MDSLVSSSFEDDDEASSEPPNIEAELEKFRNAWRSEIGGQGGGGDDGREPDLSAVNKLKNDEARTEDEAKFLFMQGVSAEQHGKLYDAIRYYRRAVQLVPDIEFRLDYRPTSQERQRTQSEVSTESLEEEADGEDLQHLIQRFSRLRANDAPPCDPATPHAGLHISSLPVELLNYIFKWVVSNDLDIVSLNNLAKVSRGFYVCARDEELWRLICQRVWGYNCGNNKQFGSWRQMFIQRPHLRYNGCYISKMTYYRDGERGLDNFYRPFHMVEYYRYVRFFPEGQILILTTPDEPSIVVGKLRNRGARVQGIMHGYYKMAGDLVTAVLKRRKVVEYYANTVSYHKQRKRRDNQNETSEQLFNVEFLLQNSSKRRHSVLVWQNFSVKTIYKPGEEDVCDFALNNQTYPQMMFSRVKSYTANADSLLK